MSVMAVFEGLSRLDSEMQRQRQMQEKRGEIFGVGRKCGDCKHWMKRPACPREKGVMAGGPTSGDMKCGTFTESASATNRRASLELELAALTGEPK